MAHFVLIHGAMHGGWCWERVAPLLQAQGHSVFAPDLPGLGQDKTPPADVTLECWGRFTAACLPPAQNTILVGHSMGGMAISQAAEYAPERIARLVYVTALLPRDGESPFMLTLRDQENAGTDRLTLQAAADGLTVFCGPAAARAAFYNETPAQWADRALALLVPQPSAVLGAPAKLSAGRFGTIPRAYIECLRDRALSISLQRAMQAASFCRHVATIDTDHSPFYSTPEILVECLLNCARQSAAV